MWAVAACRLKFEEGQASRLSCRYKLHKLRATKFNHDEWISCNRSLTLDILVADAISTYLRDFIQKISVQLIFLFAGLERWESWSTNVEIRIIFEFRLRLTTRVALLPIDDWVIWWGYGSALGWWDWAALPHLDFVGTTSARNPGAGALKYVPLVDAPKAAWLSEAQVNLQI